MDNNTNTFTLRPVRETDAEQIARIYNRYVLQTTVSFETEALTVAQMLQRIRQISENFPYYVLTPAGDEEKVVGYCCAHPWKERRAYYLTYEVTIYLDPENKGRGGGRLMMERLVDDCRRMGCRALIACITTENTASIAFHGKMGYKEVSHFRKVGHKFGRFLDVTDMELLL